MSVEKFSAQFSLIKFIAVNAEQESLPFDLGPVEQISIWLTIDGLKFE